MGKFMVCITPNVGRHDEYGNPGVCSVWRECSEASVRWRTLSGREVSAWIGPGALFAAEQTRNPQRIMVVSGETSNPTEQETHCSTSFIFACSLNATIRLHLADTFRFA